APVFAGRGDLVEKRFWRKVGAIFAIVGVSAALFIGGWTWYAWYGAVPHTVFSVKFDDISHSGATFVISNQIVFLHGGTLARYDLKSQKPAWSQELVSKQQIADVIKREDDEEAKIEAEYGKPEYSMKELSSVREKHTRISLEEELSLHVVGKNVWIADENKLTRYDWDTGSVSQQIALTNGFGEFVENGDELVMSGRSGETRVNLATGETQTTAPPAPPPNPVATLAQNAPAKNGAGKTAKPAVGAGLPLTPYGDASQPLDPQKVNEQAQHLTPAGKIALPAVVAGNLHQQQIFKAMESGNPRPSANNSLTGPAAVEDFMTVPDGDNFLQFSSKLVEEHMVEREAMKAPPKKAALDSGNVSVANEGTAINETLNELQRNNGGSTVTEDQSIYRVTVRKPDAPDAAFTT
ncbi:MAG TPA: hypothetical protein VN516_09835, partial [Candidatus Baltobacteraceae bacterium]|nr:hypothetical protein [Candidatus Baltobacteraceae bacterium]